MGRGELVLLRPRAGRLPVTRGASEEALEARNDPARENAFRQFRLNQRVSQSSRWMPMHIYAACTGTGIQVSETATLMCGAAQKRALTNEFITKKNYREETRNVGGVAVTTIETDFGRLATLWT